VDVIARQSLCTLFAMAGTAPPPDLDCAYQLTITKGGAGGSGTVTSDDSNIDCGSDCYGGYEYGTTVTLTATPDPGSDFAGWSGGGCSGTDPCIVEMVNTVTVRADFNLGKVVFVTSSRYNGNLGGIEGADEKCQSSADAAGLVGTFKAWISDRTGISPATNPDFTKYDGLYILPDKTVVADNWIDLTDGYLDHAIDQDEYGNSIVVPENSLESLVWTGTWFDGSPAYYIIGFNNCYDWTLSYLGGDEDAGTISYVDSKWSYLTTGGIPCEIERRLYCFQQ
jgi:hypothetical protein